MEDVPRQQIRPSLAELRRLPPEYDFDEEEDDDVPTYAPAATARREQPPEIGPSRQEDSNVSSDAGTRNQNRVRFDINFVEEDDPSPAGPSIAALVGSIQERKPLEASQTSERKVPRAGQSRFAVQRHLDRDAGLTNTEKPVNRRATSDAEADDEEWLDEEGLPMSAFKRKQLVSKGLRPPQTRIKRTNLANQNARPVERQYEDEGIRSIMKGISNENDAKIASMSAEEIEQDLRELQETFGSQLLEKLRQRSLGSQSAAKATGKVETSHNERNTSMTTSEIREKFFPEEAKDLPASLEWTQDMASGGSTKDLEEAALPRFDFNGHLLKGTSSADQDTLSAGLHHHGQDQEKPGYTATELLYLARSTLPGQRIMALQTLTRVMGRHMTNVETEATNGLKTSNIVNQASFIASWYVESRQNTVRSTALTCIKTCLSIALQVKDRESLVESTEFNDVKEAGANDVIPSLASHDAQKSLSLAILQVFGLADASIPEMASAIDCLAMMTRNSREMCSVVSSQKVLLDKLITKAIVAQPWPACDEAAHLSLAALYLLDILIAGHRSTAIALFDAGIPNVLIRFLSIAPWPITEHDVRYQAWQHMLQTFRLFTSFATYGIAADVYGRSHALFQNIQDWMGNPSLGKANEEEQKLILEVLASAFHLYAHWAVCATDAHQTFAHHDITFSQVSEWREVALEGLISLRRVQSRSHLTVSVISAQAAALRMLDAWCTCASTNTKEDVILTYDQKQVTSAAAEQIMEGSIGLLADLASNADDRAVAALSSSCTIASTFGEGDKVTQIVSLLLARLRSIDADSGLVMQGTRKLMCESVYKLLQRQVATQDSKLDGMIQLATALPQGCEEIAREILLQRLPPLLPAGIRESIPILAPFINELTRPRRLKAAARQQETTPATIKSTETLFQIVRIANNESDEIDPLSQAPLWWSANSGLPLRRDWPLVALDDLLHSGNCAALNRPDVLPQSWDANESQIVEAALSLAVEMWQGEGCVSPPSAEEVYVGIMKVFLLEEQQLEDTRASGKITGKDIYRREAIGSLLAKLFKIADQLSAKSQDSLEAVAERQFGKSQPFYQLYTSLVGLYDGISFGFELFARSLLVPLQTRYAPDYRRLVWADYAHCLRTITTSVAQAPGGFRAYIEEVEKDETVIRAMIVALTSKLIDDQGTELLFSIAIYQIGTLLWHHEGEESRSRHLIRALFDDHSIDVPPHKEVLRQRLLRWSPYNEEQAGQAIVDNRSKQVESVIFTNV